MFSNEDLCAASKESGVQNIAASKKGGEGSGVLCAWHIVYHLEGGVGVQVCTYCNLKGEEVLVCYTLCIRGGGVQVCKCASVQECKSAREQVCKGARWWCAREEGPFPPPVRHHRSDTPAHLICFPFDIFQKIL